MFFGPGRHRGRHRTGTQRRRAAELRIYSRRLLELADEIDTGEKHGFGSAAGQRQRAAEIRAMAEAIDAQFGKGPG